MDILFFDVPGGTANREVSHKEAPLASEHAFLVPVEDLTTEYTTSLPDRSAFHSCDCLLPLIPLPLPLPISCPPTFNSPSLIFLNVS